MTITNSLADNRKFQVYMLYISYTRTADELSFAKWQLAYGNKKGAMLLFQRCALVMVLVFSLLGICLRRAEVYKVFGDETLDVCVVAYHLFLGVAHVNVRALGEELRRTGSVVKDEQRH